MGVSPRPAVLAAVLLLGACSGNDWRVSALYGGPTSLSVLRQPQAVEAFRLDPERRDATPETPRLGGWAIASGPVPVDAATAAGLSSILLDPDTYDWARAKGCELRPGVGLRFVRDASRVDVALCFECDEVDVWRMGRRVMIEDFDAARPRLVAVAKRLFPDDPEIQALR